jgi:hypothetical protein
LTFFSLILDSNNIILWSISNKNNLTWNICYGLKKIVKSIFRSHQRLQQLMGLKMFQWGSKISTVKVRFTNLYYYSYIYQYSFQFKIPLNTKTANFILAESRLYSSANLH